MYFEVSCKIRFLEIIRCIIEFTSAILFLQRNQKIAVNIYIKKIIVETYKQINILGRQPKKLILHYHQRWKIKNSIQGGWFSNWIPTSYNSYLHVGKMKNFITYVLHNKIYFQKWEGSSPLSLWLTHSFFNQFSTLFISRFLMLWIFIQSLGRVAVF